MSIVLYDPTPLGMRDNSILGFTKPYFNDVYIVSASNMASTLTGTIFGDLINMQTWANLGMTFGTVSSSMTIYTLQTGWKYIYNYTQKVFNIYDSSGNLKDTRTGVTTIDGLGIDMSVQKSHQFEIVFDKDAEDTPFIIVGKLNNKTFEEIIAETSDVGIYNTYKSDRIRPYLPTDADNPTWDYKHTARQPAISIDSYSFYSEDIKTYITDDFSIRPNGMMKTDKMTGTNMFYVDGYNLLTPKIKYKDKFMSKVNMDVMLLCLLSISLYPGQLPVIRDGETDNNRPLYEPWTLYLYEYLVNRYIFDIDNEYPIPVFDLSPSWG